MGTTKALSIRRSYLCNSALLDQLHSERFYRVIPIILLPILFVLVLMASDIEKGYTVVTSESEVKKVLEEQKNTITESGIPSHIDENPLFTTTRNEESIK